MDVFKQHNNTVSEHLPTTLVRQIRSMAILLVISFACTMVSIVVWFKESGYIGDDTPSAEDTYQLQMYVLKDANGVRHGDNLLTGVYGDNFCDKTVSLDSYIKQLSVTIYNVGEGKAAFNYLLIASQLQDDGAFRPIFRSRSSQVVSPGGTEVKHTISVTPGTTVRVQLYTSTEGDEIVVSDNVETLTATGSDTTVYITRDITYGEALVFSEQYPTIDLAGHTLTVDDLRYETEKGDFSIVEIRNGTLIVKGKRLSDQDSVVCVGEGRVRVLLKNLK